MEGVAIGNFDLGNDILTHRVGSFNYTRVGVCLQFDLDAVIFMFASSDSISLPISSLKEDMVIFAASSDSSVKFHFLFEKSTWLHNEQFKYGYPLIQKTSMQVSPVFHAYLANQLKRIAPNHSVVKAQDSVPFEELGNACMPSNQSLRKLFQMMTNSEKSSFKDIALFCSSMYGFLVGHFECADLDLNQVDDGENMNTESLVSDSELNKFLDSTPFLKSLSTTNRSILFNRLKRKLGSISASNWEACGISGKFFACVRVPSNSLGPKMRMEKSQLILQVFDEFLTAAQEAARKIVDQINDKPLIDESKIGGIAGGAKYISKGILLKLSQDVSFPGRRHFLYGGQEENHELASKAAAHELNCAIQFASQIPSSHIIVPMQTIIDYKGMQALFYS
jgi:hypothetical protein